MPLVLATSTMFGAKADKWSHVGDSHAHFAAALGAEQTRFDSTFRTWIATLVNNDCLATDDKVRGLDAGQIRRIALYTEYFCKPWLETWDKAIAPCDRDRTPRWCLDENALSKRVDLGPYFATLTRALRDASDSLVRYNTMELIVNSATPHMITDYPRDLVDQWLAGAASEFLKVAKPDDAITVAQSIRDTWIGVGPGVAHEFVAYAERSDVMTKDQRDQLIEITKKRYGTSERP